MRRSEGAKGIAWIERCRPKFPCVCLIFIGVSGFGHFFPNIFWFSLLHLSTPFLFYSTLVDKACLHAWDSFTPLTWSNKLYSGNVRIVNLLSPTAEGKENGWRKCMYYGTGDMFGWFYINSDDSFTTIDTIILGRFGWVGYGYFSFFLLSLTLLSFVL